MSHRFSTGQLTERPLMELAKQEAREQFRHPTLVQSLARWWSKKYRLPSNHELFQNSDIYELCVEFWVDKYESKPIESYRNDKGEIQFTDTGDDLVDRWEQQIADGEIPDLLEAFDEESIRHMQKLRQVAKDRDPYQGATIRDTSDKMRRILDSEKLKGFKDDRKHLEDLFNRPTFLGEGDD